MNQQRLKNVFFRVKDHESRFDMADWHNDFAHHAACLAVGEEIGTRTVLEYRGVPQHIEEIGAQFLQATAEEMELLCYLGNWPSPAWRLYRKGQRLHGLLLTINLFMLPS